MRTCLPCFALILGLVASAVPAQFTLGEMLIDAPGTDEGQEFVEIRGAASAPLSGYHLLIIEGDGSGAGILDLVIDLNAYSTGANGLLLIRDTSAVLSPAPDPQTNVVVFNPTPDIENGTNTYVLGFGTPPAVMTDLDANDDGILDAGIPGITVVDAVAGTDGGSSDRMYAGQLGGVDFTANGAFSPDCFYRVYDAAGAPFCWTIADVTAPGVTGPFAFDFSNNEVQGGLAGGYGPQGLNPGSHNGSISLASTTYGVSSASGGTQVLLMDAGPANAGALYLFLGSFSGTQPGLPLNPSVTLPLNPDAYLFALLNAHNTPILNPSLGILDGRGRAACAFTLPPGGVVRAGTVLDHAAVAMRLNPFAITFATTPARVVVQ